MNCPKLNLKQCKQIKQKNEDIWKFIYGLEYQKQLEQWSRLKCSEIIFDSNIDDWSKDTSVFNERIIGKKQLLFLIKNEDGEIFGYYSNAEISGQTGSLIATDNKSFHFNLKSENKRLQHPMKFEKINIKYGHCLFDQSMDRLITLGDIYLNKENSKSFSWCDEYEKSFNYNGIKNALCGKRNFSPNRIVVIQMKK